MVGGDVSIVGFVVYFLVCSDGPRFIVCRNSVQEIVFSTILEKILQGQSHAKRPLIVSEIEQHLLCTRFPEMQFLRKDGTNRTETHIHLLADALYCASTICTDDLVNFIHQSVRDDAVTLTR